MMNFGVAVNVQFLEGCMDRINSILDSRELASGEIELLRHILSHVAPERLQELHRLKVIVRCSCRQCPTVIFGTSREQALSTLAPKEVANYTGVNGQGIEVGLSVLVRADALSEMEVWSLDGAPVRSLPTLESLMLVPATA